MENVYNCDRKHTLGRGSYGTVFKGSKKSDQDFEVAIKRMDNDDFFSASAERELQILKALKHENVVCLLDDFKDDDNFWIIMEYCEAGNLEVFLKKQNPGLAIKLNIMHDCSKAVNYMHSQSPKIIHRDLKLQNILLKAERGRYMAKVCDFGLSRAFVPTEDQPMHTECGTPFYRAPELVEKKADGTYHYHAEVDIFSLGLVFQVILQYNGDSKYLEPTLVGCSNEMISVANMMLFSRNEGRAQPQLFVIDANEDQVTRGVKSLVVDMTKFEPKDRTSIKDVTRKLHKLRVINGMKRQRSNVLDIIDQTSMCEACSVWKKEKSALLAENRILTDDVNSRQRNTEAIKLEHERYTRNLESEFRNQARSKKRQVQSLEQEKSALLAKNQILTDQVTSLQKKIEDIKLKHDRNTTNLGTEDQDQTLNNERQVQFLQGEKHSPLETIQILTEHTICLQRNNKDLKLELDQNTTNLETKDQDLAHNNKRQVHQWIDKTEKTETLTKIVPTKQKETIDMQEQQDGHLRQVHTRIAETEKIHIRPLDTDLSHQRQGDQALCSKNGTFTNGSCSLAVDDTINSKQEELDLGKISLNFPEFSSANDRRWGFPVVVALCLGTSKTCCGLAFISDPADIRIITTGGSTYEVPTSVLTDENGRCIAYGYEAEAKYSAHSEKYFTEKKNISKQDAAVPVGVLSKTFHLVKTVMKQVRPSASRYNDDPGKYCLFRNFTDERNISKQSVVKATNNKARPVVDILSIALEHLMKKAVEQIQTSTSRTLNADKIQWVITVPSSMGHEGEVVIKEAILKAGYMDPGYVPYVLMQLESDALWNCCVVNDHNKVADQVLLIHIQDDYTVLMTDSSRGRGRGTMQIIEAWSETSVKDILLVPVKNVLLGHRSKDFQSQYNVNWNELIPKVPKITESSAQSESCFHVDVGFNLITNLKDFWGSDLPTIIRSNAKDKTRFLNGQLLLGKQTLGEAYDSVISQAHICAMEIQQMSELLNIKHVIIVGSTNMREMLNDALKKMLPEQIGVSSLDTDLPIVRGAVKLGLQKMDRV